MSAASRSLPFALLVLCVAGGAAAWIGFAPAPPAAPGADHVVLLHGLGRSKAAMWYLERRLREAGYHVHNIGYPSLDADIDELAEHVGEQLRADGIDRAPRVHFVTHSMGGIVARAYLAKHPMSNLGRVVLLAPPNGGSPIIDGLREAGVSIVPIGPAGRALGAESDDAPAMLPIPDYPVGIIAGSADLLVPVERARLEGMDDFLVVNSGHAWMRNNSTVADQTIEFLRTGRFAH